jgi:hypothetical protein
MMRHYDAVELIAESLENEEEEAAKSKNRFTRRDLYWAYEKLRRAAEREKHFAGAAYHYAGIGDNNDDDIDVVDGANNNNNDPEDISDSYYSNDVNDGEYRGGVGRQGRTEFVSIYDVESEDDEQTATACRRDSFEEICDQVNKADVLFGAEH